MAKISELKLGPQAFRIVEDKDPCMVSFHLQVSIQDKVKRTHSTLSQHTMLFHQQSR
jgi:hypothetical protein